MLTKYPSTPLTSLFKDSFAQRLLVTAEQFPQNTGLWVDGQAYSYQEMVASGLAIAATLQSLITAPGNCGILAYRSAVAYQGIWGALFAGCCYVPMNPRFPVIRNQAALQSADCKILIVDQRSEDAARELLQKAEQPLTVLLPEHKLLPEWCQGSQHQFLCQGQLKPANDWQQPDVVSRYAYLLFTSGTTGKPKGIAITHENVMAYAQTILASFDLTSDDRFTQMSDLTFDLSVHDLVSAWSVGGALYVVPETALLCPADFVKRHELTCWNSVPSLLGFIKKFGKMKPGAFPCLRYSFFCGEALPIALAKEWQAASPQGQVVNLYGPTEATIAITALTLTPDLPEQGNMPIGHVFANQDIAVVNAEGKLVTQGEEGELWLGGSQVADGYWQDPERTNNAFIEKTFSGYNAKRWYATGDIVSIDSRFGLLFHGRKDFQVKINGFRVELGEIESVIRNQFSCDWVAVVPWPVDRNGAAKGLVAWLAGEADDE